MKILYIAPHLSTGGSPQYLLKKIQVLVKEHEVYCVEYSNHGGFTVQRNQIKEILKDRFFELGENKMKVMDIINKINPEVVHLEEMPEYFMDGNLAIELYSKDRKYKLIETSHDSSFNPESKTMFPDKILFVSKYQMETLKSLDVPMDVCEYPIVINPRKPREEALKVLGLDPNKKHVVNVGLFTPRKNQAEIIEYAKQLRNYPIQFHFIGNQADNFKFYWEPLRKDFPPNCTWWDERKDVHNFYQAADLFLFTSRGTNNDKETSPLVIREAISYNIPSLIYNLPVYLGMYDKYENIQYLDFDSKENNINKILKTLKIDYMEKKFYTMKGEEDLSSYKYPNTAMEILQKYGDGACMYWNNFVYKELERFDVTVDAGDVFVDLGANIGMSARYAHDKGAREIYCFEPDPNMVEILKKNVPSAKIYQNAIDKDIKEIELYHWPHNPVNIGPKYKTSTVRIKDVINMIGKPIDYLKVDIEGFEDSAFDELSQSDLSMVKKFFIEHHIPEKVNQFCEKLKSKGLDVKIEYGMGQNFIYATLSKLNKTKYNFTVNWDSGEQKVTYSCDKDINLPISITLREYKSNAVLWSAEYDHIPANCNYWMIPIPKSICDYSTSEFISGIKFCVYNRNTDEQIYEYPFFHKFVNIPTVTLSNKAPYFINYLEYFVENKYDCWFKTGKKFNTAIDVGANIGIFTEFLIQNKLAKKILAVECDDQALYDLKKNYELNDNVKIIQKALSYSNEPITFYKCKENSIISTTIPPEKIVHHGAGSINKIKTVVDTITIEEIVKEFDHIDLLKIDVEGAEYSIFEKLNSNISKNIDHMFIECHFFESDCIEKYEMLKQKVISMGYEIDDKLITRANSKIGSSESIFCTRK